MQNGDINNGIITPNKKANVKKIVPPVDDTRNDLLKAIRDGELGPFFLNKNSIHQLIRLIKKKHFLYSNFRHQIAQGGEK